MKRKLLFYSDCPLFAGCEIVIKNLISSENLNDEYRLFFMFRKSEKYLEDLKKINFKSSIVKIPLKLFSFDSLYFKFVDSKRLSIILSKILLKVVEVIFLFNLFNFIFLYINIKKINPDVVHINNGGYPGAKSANLLAIVCKLQNIKAIYTVNNIALNRNKIFYFFSYISDLAVSNSVRYFTTSSKYATNKLKKRIKNKNIYPIVNSVDDYNIKKINLNKYKKNKNTKIIITAGLLVERKGFESLLSSIIIVKEKYDNFYLLICGEGSESIKLNNFIDENRLTNYVKIIGYKSNLLEYINASDFFILPSIRNEDSPYVIIEALMLAKPIISTIVAGIPEMIINKKNGYLIKPNSVNELANSIYKILNLNKKQVKIFSKNSRMIFLNKFSLRDSIDKYIGLYKN